MSHKFKVGERRSLASHHTLTTGYRTVAAREIFFTAIACIDRESFGNY